MIIWFFDQGLKAFNLINDGCVSEIVCKVNESDRFSITLLGCPLNNVTTQEQQIRLMRFIADWTFQNR